MLSEGRGAGSVVAQDTGAGAAGPQHVSGGVDHRGGRHLAPAAGAGSGAFAALVWPVAHDTLAQGPAIRIRSLDRLYGGGNSFLDWREQTYRSERAPTRCI